MTNVQDSVFQLFQRVENKHGWMLVRCKTNHFHYYNFCKVSHALAYVTASKNGVSEPEIEDFISLDDKVGDIEGVSFFPKRPIMFDRLQRWKA